MKRLIIPLPRGWSLRFTYDTGDSNSHGPKFTTLRSTWQVVKLGLGYNVRHTWGRRLITYKADGSCRYFSATLWDGKQHGIN